MLIDANSMKAVFLMSYFFGDSKLMLRLQTAKTYRHKWTAKAEHLRQSGTNALSTKLANEKSSNFSFKQILVDKIFNKQKSVNFENQ